MLIPDWELFFGNITYNIYSILGKRLNLLSIYFRNSHEKEALRYFFELIPWIFLIFLFWRGVASLKIIQSAMVVLEKLLAILVAVMVLLVFLNVLTRYVFHVSITWSDEIASFLFVFVVAIGAVVATARDEHLSVEFFTYFNCPGLTRLFKGISLILVIGALGVLVFGGIQLVQIGMGHPAPVTGIPIGYITLVVVVSMASMLAIVIFKLFHLLKGEK